jgi:DNA processing protein
MVAARPGSKDPVTEKLLAVMGFDPVDMNLLAERSGLDVAALNARLLTLELDGLIEMLPGGIYRRLA